MFARIWGCVFVVLLTVGMADVLASSLQAAPRRGAFTIICDRAKAVQFWNGDGWTDVTVRNIYIQDVNLDSRGYSRGKLVIRFDNERGEFKQYNLEFYEISSDEEKGKLYRLTYDYITGWDLFNADESHLADRRRGAFTLVNKYDVEIPIQTWGGKKYTNSTVEKRTKLRIWHDIDLAGKSESEPYIKFNNGKGKVLSYRLESQEIFGSEDLGTPYHFTYDELTGWDLKQGEAD